MASSGDHRHLPEDVLIEILTRLPVKSLLRFTRVCKYWYTLIKNPNFITMHLHHTNNNDNHPRLVVHYCIPDEFDTGKCVFALFPDETLTVEPPLIQDIGYLRMPKYSAEVLGPSNGLFFLYNSWDSNDTRVTLWNPATREFRILPVPQSSIPPNFTAYSNVFGFGLDISTNDCKVVWIRYLCSGRIDIPYGPPVVTVYTLGTDCWRHLHPVLDSVNSLTIRSSMYTTYLNGAYYWLSRDRDHGYTILVFDMSSEVFREIKAPVPAADNPYWGDLVLHNDSIALLLNEYSGGFLESIDIWLMKQEGFWTKHLTVGPFLQVKRPLGFWKNDELLLEMIASKLVLYNPYYDEIRYLGIQGHFQYVFCRVFSYKESLVSVKGRNKG